MEGFEVIFQTESLIVFMAAVITIIFCFTFLLLWKLNYGLRIEAKEYMRVAQPGSWEGDKLENGLTC